MADPDGGREQNPRTLSTGGDAEPDAPAPPLTKDEAKAAATNAREAWEAWKRSMLEQGIMIDETSGKIVRVVRDEPVQPPGISPEDWAILSAAEGGGTSYVSIPDTEGQLLWDAWKSSVEDAKEAVSVSGTARSYLDTEADKTSEITRQFKDFDNRASLLYDLMSDEQDYAMKGDDQNIQNAAAREKGYMLPGEGLHYTPYMSGGPLSQLLSPSLPDYVRPDSRLNWAV